MKFSKTLPAAIPWDPNRIPQFDHDGTEFYVQDATNFYIPPAYSPTPPEPNKGIYPYFHKIKDWGVELDALDIASNPRECQ